MEIWVPILVVCIIGLICGVGLSVASSVMAVKEDERFPAIRDCLPGANCGACGFTGCDGYAKALLQPGTKTNLCVPGGAEAAKKLAAVLDVEAEETVRNVAVVKCSGTCDVTQPKAEYRGIHTCSAAKLLFGGPGSCTYGCIGYGDCVAVCPQKAISIDRGVAFVDAASCIGCGLCAKQCPQSVIALVPETAKSVVACSNRDKGAMTRKACSIGCIGCMKCAKNCEADAITVSGNLAAIDYAKCTGCGKCAEVCPAGAAKLGQKLCTKTGPVVYPKQPLPDDNHWGEHMWSPNYKDDNQKQCHESGTAPCKTACPAHIAVQGYINLAAQGRYLDALKLIKQDNPFPAVCGSICNRRCEEACTRGDVDRAVAIDEIKKFVAEQELQADKRYIPKVITHRGIADPYPEKIAIIGAGPAGLSCAYYLANMGYENVTVFDKNEVPGGMLTLGIPSFRLEKDVVNAEIEVLKEMGVHFQCGVEIGKDLTIDQLREQGYKGFYLAIGAQKSAPIGVPGEDLSGVYGGVDFLRKVNLGKKPRIGKKCAVIGGGNVAMDVCRTAIRLGAKDTYVIYRRSQAEMPADAEEVAEAMEEGVQFRFLSAPAEIIGENGKVKALKVEIMELGEPDAKGRRKPVGTGKFETIEVTSVIGAIGQRVDLGRIAPEAMAFNRNGTVQADGVTYQTAQPDIFAGGDVVTGPKFAIDAIAAGREGAISLHRYVHEGQSLTLARDPREFYELDKKQAVVPIDCFDAPARQTVAHDASKAKTFANDRITFTEAQVKAEASRCLGCGVSVVDQNKCIGCGLCTTRCEFDAIHLQRDMPEASRMYRTEDKMKAILPHMVKRAAKLTIKDIKGKRAK